MEFDSLYAIFARYGLDSIDVDSVRMLPGAIKPMGVIYSYFGHYEPLGIEPEFNCLYFVGSASASSGYEARVVPVSANQDACKGPPTAPGTTLQVDALEMSGADKDDYPAVARWDWDTKHGVQYIGIRCGRAWCEVHRKSSTMAFESSPKYSRSGSVAHRRSAEIKGWYDEQYLALPPTAGTRATPSNIVATLIPDSALGEGTDTTSLGSRFANRWVRVASVATGAPPGIYATKLNLAQSPPPDPANVVYLCYGPVTGGSSPCFTDSGQIPKCKTVSNPDWWGKIESADGSPGKYFCIVRRTHPYIRIPGVVRWRWTVHDDTMWIRCLNGCCEVQGHV